MVALSDAVVGGTFFLVGMPDDTDALEQVQCAVDGRCVNTGDAALHVPSQGLGREVALGAHDLLQNGHPLGSDAVAPLAQLAHDRLYVMTHVVTILRSLAVAQGLQQPWRSV